MSTLTIGKVQTIYSADSTKFDTATAGVGKQFDQVGRQAAQAANKVAEAGNVIDRTAAVQERSKERMRRAWQQELLAQDKAIAKEQELGRARELAALKADIEARSVAKSSTALKELALTAEKTGKLLKEAFALGGLAIGAEVLVGGFKEMIGRTVETGVELHRLSEQTGINVRDLSVLKYAASVTGIEFETLTKGFKKLSTQMEGVDHGAKLSIQAFNDAGISQKELAATGGDLFKVLELVADKFESLPDGYRKNAAASELFGRAGQQLIPILNEGAAGLERLKAKAPIFSDEEVERLKAIHTRSIELTASWDNLGKSMTTAFGPLLQRELSDAALDLDTLVEGAKSFWDWMSRIRFGAGMGGPRFYLAPEASAPVSSHSGGKPGPAPNPAPPPGGGGSGSAKDDSIVTLNLSNIADTWIEQQTKIHDANAAFYAGLDADAAKAQKDWDAAANAIDWKGLAATFKMDRPDVTLAAAMPGRFEQLRDAVDKTIASFTDLPGHLSELFTQGVGTLNEAMTRALTGSGGGFAQVFRGLGESAIKSGLQMAEGGMLKRVPAVSSWLSKTQHAATMNVQAGLVNVSGGGGRGPGIGPLPGMPGDNLGPAGSGVTGRRGGWLGWIQQALGIAGIFAGKGAPSGDTIAPSTDFSLDNYQIPSESMDMLDLPGRAYGGPVLAGVPYMVGEQGPEPFVPASDGHIFPHGGGGGETAFYQIDARGADAAAIQQRIGRALEQVHGSAIQNAAAVTAERRRRTPNRSF